MKQNMCVKLKRPMCYNQSPIIKTLFIKIKNLEIVLQLTDYNINSFDFVYSTIRWIRIT